MTVASVTAKATAGSSILPIRTRASSRPWIIFGLRMAVLFGLIALWELISDRGVDSFLISRPSEVFPQVWDWLTDGTIWFHLQSTLRSALFGFVIGGSIAVVIGYALGQSKTLADVTEPFITAFYSLPKLALVPLFIMWFGIGVSLQVAIAALITFFLMFYNVFFGIREVDEELVEQIRVMSGTPRDVALRVRLPSALVWVVAGLKISIPQAIVGVVVAEILAGQRGLGYLVAHNANQFNSKGTFAALIVLLVLGFVVDRVVALLTRRSLAWKNARELDRT